MGVRYLIARRDHLLEELDRLQYNFEPASILLVIELERIMETLDRLTMESPSLEDLRDVTCGASRRGTAGHHQE